MDTYQTSMPSVLDKEITTSKADAFGHAHFAKALGDLIEAQANQPPFSIGLLGDWGTGKSSIKAMYLESLLDDVRKGADNKTRRQRVTTITFNAWRYGGENIKRALLRHVFLSLDGDESAIDDALFRQLQRTSLEARSALELAKDFWDRWVFAGWQMLIVFAVILVPLVLAVKWAGIINDFVLGSVLSVGLAVGAPMLKHLLDAKRFLVPRYAPVTKVERPSSSAEEYENLLSPQLKTFKQSTQGRLCERLVIFVDDLDRLSAEEMISGLDAIRSFMDMPADRVPSGLGIVFVISCDEERVADALADRRGTKGSFLPGAILNRSDARRFLDRIFQFRLEIPQVPKRDMRSFAIEKITKATPAVLEDLTRRGISLETLVEYLIHIRVQSPRNAIQLLNAFIQSWWLASRREREGAGTDRAGGLQEGAVTSYPLPLAAITVLRVDFPDFYGDLQRDPDLLLRFTEVFVRGESLEAMPEVTGNILAKYTDDSRALRKEFRALRQYVASLQGLQWPPSLQPLIQLSQDPITRRYGPGATKLFEAFVSGDVQGVLGELGRQIDSKTLSPDDVRRLRDIQEELYRETDVRRHNAASVLAALADRLPTDEAPLLLSPLVQWLVETPQLRWRLGIQRIGEVLEKVPAYDKRRIGQKLIEDLLQVNGEINFRTVTGETPSLNEAVLMVREACSLVLRIRSQIALDAQWEGQLLSWLGSRHVAVSGKDYELPVSDLEQWVTQHETELLPSFGPRYAYVMLNELRNNQTEGLDVPGVLSRIKTVLDALWTAGQQSRETFWQLLDECASVQDEDFVRLAWTYMLDYEREAGPSELSSFVKALAQRLIKEINDSEAWALDWEAAGEALLTLMQTRRQDLDVETLKDLGTLAQDWSTTPESGKSAVQLLDLLVQTKAAKPHDVVTAWIGRMLTDLPNDCVDWLSRKFDVLNEDLKNKFVSHLQLVTQRDNLTTEEGARFERAMSRVTEKGIKHALMQGFLSSLNAQISSWYSNPNEYVERVFPVIPRMLEYAPSNTGAMLYQLLANNRGNPKLFGWLHARLAGHWIKPRPEWANYNPTHFFDEASTAARQWPNVPEAFGPLLSMQDMVVKGLVTVDRRVALADTACALWPHHKTHALKVILAADWLPSLEQLINLLDNSALTQEDDRVALAAAWSHAAQKMNDDQRVSGTTLLLRKPPQGSPEVPDMGLQIWVDVQGEHGQDWIKQVLLASDIEDLQRKRMWLQVERLAVTLGARFFQEVLPELCGLENTGDTIRAVLDAEAHISSLFPTPAERHTLAQTLLECFFDAKSQEARNRLAQWLKRAGGGTVLRQLDKYAPSEADIDDLLRVFPGLRVLEKLKRRANPD